MTGHDESPLTVKRKEGTQDRCVGVLHTDDLPTPTRLPDSDRGSSFPDWTNNSASETVVSGRREGGGGCVECVRGEGPGGVWIRVALLLRQCPNGDFKGRSSRHRPDTCRMGNVPTTTSFDYSHPSPARHFLPPPISSFFLLLLLLRTRPPLSHPTNLTYVTDLCDRSKPESEVRPDPTTVTDSL